MFYHKTGKSATVLIYNIDTDEEETAVLDMVKIYKEVTKYAKKAHPM